MPDGSVSAGYGTMAGLIVLIAASVWLGLLAQKVVERGSFMKGYFLGNRGLGSWALALTATVQSGGTFVGFPSFVYTNGWVVALWIGSYMVVPLSGFAILAKRFAQLSRRTGAITVPDLFRERFGNANVGLIASLLILFFMTAMMIAQFKAGALVMKVSIPEDVRNWFGFEDAKYGAWYQIGLAVFTLTVVGYTLIGGFLAAVWTDLFQSVIMWIGVLLLLPLTLLAVGGLPAAQEQLRNEVSVGKLHPERVDVEKQLHELNGRLREYASAHGGQLPPDLSGVATNERTDPITGRPLAYYGDEAKLDSTDAADRAIVETPIDEWGWQSILYLDGSVKSSRPSVERQLRQLGQSLRDYAVENDGRLPPDLTRVDSQRRTDPITEAPLEYYGEAYQIAPVGATRRVVVALTPPDPHGGRTVLYSNGVVKSAVYSNPGDLLTAPGPHDFHPFGVALSYFFIWVFAGLGSPAGMVRVMACQDTPTIRRSIFLLSSYNLCIYIPLILICICGRALLPDLAVSDEIVPSLAVKTTSGFAGGSLVAGLILSAPFGAVMATVSSYLVVIASGLVRDVYQRFLNPYATERELRRLSYLVMVVIGAIGIATNIDPVEFLQRIVVFSGTCGATAFVVPAAMAAFWRRATAAGVVSSMLVGVGCTLLMYAIGYFYFGEFRAYCPVDIDPIIWGLAGSLLAGVGVSLCTSPPDERLVSKMFDVESPRPAA